MLLKEEEEHCSLNHLIEFCHLWTLYGVMGFQVHQRVPLFVGSTEEVEKLEKYLA
ncbi:hypothetical protein BDL97_03G126400 [Sphagnum fallax]|nr:hypothetical protein BDL97_03G126400 [Sphagnum fallax]